MQSSVKSQFYFFFGKKWIFCTMNKSTPSEEKLLCTVLPQQESWYNGWKNCTPNVDILSLHHIPFLWNTAQIKCPPCSASVLRTNSAFLLGVAEFQDRRFQTWNTKMHLTSHTYRWKGERLCRDTAVFFILGGHWLTAPRSFWSFVGCTNGNTLRNITVMTWWGREEAVLWGTVGVMPSSTLIAAPLFFQLVFGTVLLKISLKIQDKSAGGPAGPKAWTAPSSILDFWGGGCLGLRPGCPPLPS